MSTFLSIFPFATIAIILLLALWLFSQEMRLRRLFAGKNARNLEETLHALVRHLGKLEDELGQEKKELAVHDLRLKSTVRFVKTLRFNPFHGNGEGGNQSFATAFIDEKGNGVILSTLYTRERVSVYGKPIVNFASQFPLTKEERDVLEEVRNEASNPKF